jgi:hypothetical protein
MVKGREVESGGGRVLGAPEPQLRILGPFLAAFLLTA